MKRVYKSIIVILSVLMVTMGLVACGGNNSGNQENSGGNVAGQYPFTVKDAKDTDVVIDKEITKVVSLGPSTTEMIYALGKGDTLVGRTSYCDYPQEVQNVQDVGTLTEPNLEIIASLKPDIVLASAHFEDEVAKKLEELNIKVVYLYSEESFESVYNSIEILGQILNASNKADEIIAGMKNKVQEVTDKVKGLEKPSVYYVVGFGEGDFTAGGDTFIGEMINLAGGSNIAEDAKGWTYSKEALAEKNPEIIVLSKYYDTKAGFIAADFYKDLEAVKNDKVFEIDNNKLDRQGPRLAEGLEDLAKIIHPEAFK